MGFRAPLPTSKPRLSPMSALAIQILTEKVVEMDKEAAGARATD